MICAQATELLGREVATHDLHLDGDEALLLLGGHVGLLEALELGDVAVG